MTTPSEVEQLAEQMIALLGLSHQSLKSKVVKPIPANQIGSEETLSKLLQELLVDFIGMEVRNP